MLVLLTLGVRIVVRRAVRQGELPVWRGEIAADKDRVRGRIEISLGDLNRHVDLVGDLDRGCRERRRQEKRRTESADCDWSFHMQIFN